MRQIHENELDDRYRGYLDDIFDEVNICGYIYTPSDVLFNVDHIAYIQGLHNYIDGLLTDEVIFKHSDGNYYDESPGIDDND